MASPEQFTRKIVSIDPGLKRVALAVWNEADWTLLHACLVQCEHTPDTIRAQKWRNMAIAVGARVDEIVGPEWPNYVIEVPQVYSGPRAEDPNDLIDLAGVLGAISNDITCTSVLWSPLPREWKGQLPKEITKQRVEAKLTEAEKMRISWPIKSLAHNVYDAIHLGIVYLEWQRLRVFPK